MIGAIAFVGLVRLTNSDRWFFIQLYRLFPSILNVVTIIRPETLVRWHCAGFHCYWRWKSHPRGGRPQIETDLRALIQRMSVEIPSQQIADLIEVSGRPANICEQMLAEGVLLQTKFSSRSPE